MTDSQKTMLGRLGAAVLFLVAALLVPAQGLLQPGLFLAAYLLAGYDVLLHAGQRLKRGNVFDENFLMSIATLGALLLGEYPEAVAVMIFYQVGEFFQGIAVARSRASIAALLGIRPDYARVQRAGALETVAPEEVAVGETVVVKPGEKVPLDGVVLAGFASLDTAALTGEALPRDVAQGDAVISGCVNIDGLLHIRVTHVFYDSTVAKILELVESSSAHKAPAERFITRFSRYYTPGVTVCALLLALLPPLAWGAPWSEWVHRGLVFLMVSCPCALVLSVPLAFFGGIGGASRRGILIKGANQLEALADTRIFVLDKTGTLTQGKFRVSRVYGAGMSEEDLLSLAAAAEAHSPHPIAASLRVACAKPPDAAQVTDVTELPGQGLSALVGGKRVHVGNARLMENVGVAPLTPDDPGTVVHVAAEGIYAGYIVIADQLKPGAKEALAALKRLGVRQTVLLTGDREDVAQHVGDQLGIELVCAELLPGDKVAHVERLLQHKGKGERLAFVGDGVNDAPVLARADVGIAMGAMGSDAAIEAADIVLMDDQLAKLPLALTIARGTRAIVIQNVAAALGIKFCVLVLGALGMASMWAAVAADVGVSLLATLNAMRALRIR